MGATMADVSKDWTRLWILTGVYAILAVAAARVTISGGRSNEP
jgi:ABC-2 type transport system permease protein